MANFWEVNQKIDDELERSNLLQKKQKEMEREGLGAHSFAEEAANAATDGIHDYDEPAKKPASLEDRALELAAKTAPGKKLGENDFSKLLVMLGLIKLKNNPLVDRERVDALADDKFIEKNAKILSESKAFKNVMEKDVPTDLQSVKNGNTYEALALEQKKVMEEEEKARDRMLKENERKRAKELEEKVHDITANKEIGQEMLNFNKLDTPEQKKRRLEELFGVDDLSKMSPKDMEKAKAIREFVEGANQIEEKSIDFNKQKDQPDNPQKKLDNQELMRRF